MFASVCTELDLTRMMLDRRGNVNRFDVWVIQQLFLATVRSRDLELLRDLVRVAWIHHRHQAAVFRLQHAGNRTAPRNPARTDHTNINSARHAAVLYE